MKLKPFKELIGLSKEKLDEALAPIRARQVKAKADLEITQIETQLLSLETEVQESCAAKDINLPKLIDKLDEIDLLERRKRKFAEVVEQLFPVEAA
jgi:hypothetical protein